MKNLTADGPFWGAEVNTSVMGRRSGYRVPLVSAVASAEREGISDVLWQPTLLKLAEQTPHGGRPDLWEKL